MQCFEFEMVCLMLFQHVRVQDPFAAFEQMVLADALEAHGVLTIAALKSLTPAQLDDVLESMIEPHALSCGATQTWAQAA